MAAVGQGYSFAELACPTKSIQHSGYGARILAQFGRFAFKTINFLNDLNRQEDIIVLELKERIGVMEQNIGIKDVILFHEQTT